jgi:hypothetical protein
MLLALSIASSPWKEAERLLTPRRTSFSKSAGSLIFLLSLLRTAIGNALLGGLHQHQGVHQAAIHCAGADLPHRVRRSGTGNYGEFDTLIPVISAFIRQINGSVLSIRLVIEAKGQLFFGACTGDIQQGE